MQELKNKLMEIENNISSHIYFFKDFFSNKDLENTNHEEALNII